MWLGQSDHKWTALNTSKNNHKKKVCFHCLWSGSLYLCGVCNSLCWFIALRTVNALYVKTRWICPEPPPSSFWECLVFVLRKIENMLHKKLCFIYCLDTHPRRVIVRSLSLFLSLSAWRLLTGFASQWRAVHKGMWSLNPDGCPEASDKVNPIACLRFLPLRLQTLEPLLSLVAPTHTCVVCWWSEKRWLMYPQPSKPQVQAV